MPKEFIESSKSSGKYFRVCGIRDHNLTWQSFKIPLDLQVRRAQSLQSWCFEDSSQQSWIEPKFNPTQDFEPKFNPIQKNLEQALHSSNTISNTQLRTGS